MYTANLCDCDGSSSGSGGSSVDVDELKKEIEEYILEKYPQIDVETLKTSITSDEDFKKEVAALVETSEVNTDEIVSTVQTNLKADSEFKSEVAKSVDTESIATTVETNIKTDETFKSEVAALVESSDVDTGAIETNVKNSLKSDNDFKSEIAKSVTVDTDTITSTVETNVKSDDTFKKEVAALVEVSSDVDTETIENNVKSAIKTDDEFKSTVAALVDTTDIASTVETNVKADGTFKSDVAKLVEVDTDSIETNIKADETFKKSVAALVETSGSDVNTETIENNVKTSIKEDSEFKSEIATTVETNVKADDTFKKEVAALVEVTDINTDELTSTIESNIKSDETFKSEIVKEVGSIVVDTDAIASIVETNVKEDETFKSEIVSSTETNIKADTDFKTAVAALVDTSDVETNIKADSDFKSEISSTIETTLKEDETFKSAVAEAVDTNTIISTVETNIKGDSDFKAAVAALIDIDKSFLTETGFGNLRYYNNNFSYYNGSEWIDIVITDNNQFIINMTPANMPSFGTYIERDDKCISLIWEEPDDTIIDSQVLCYVEGIKIVRKLGSEPEDESDGTLIMDLKRKDFGKYSSNLYTDSDIVYTIGNTYYYKFFPYSNSGLINNCTDNCKSVAITDYSLFGFELNQSESDPTSMITYIEDNVNFTSAHMDFDNDIFNYGDWENAWFIKNLKAVMLKYDGTVDYELDKNDYSKKVDGETDSDITNSSYEGNVMIGIPTVYYKIVPDSDNTNIYRFYFSDKKIDDSYLCWSHLDSSGNIIPYCYISAYTSSADSSNRLRSISGTSNKTGILFTSFFSYARANNIDDATIWNMGLYCDQMLITFLLLLIGKSTDTQAVFGYGNCPQTSGNVTSDILSNGTLDNKGLFYGKNTYTSAVKVFGIENFWGNLWRETLGLFNNATNISVKMCQCSKDGSTAEDYNTTDDNLIISDFSISSSLSTAYIKNLGINTDLGYIVPITSGGSNTTYYTDTFWVTNQKWSYSAFGNCKVNTGVGVFCTMLSLVTSTFKSAFYTSWLSCKPLLVSNTSEESETTETTEEVSE